ncbi:hypothetical protein D3C85_1367990 [compost metagenome]
MHKGGYPSRDTLPSWTVGAISIANEFAPTTGARPFRRLWGRIHSLRATQLPPAKPEGRPAVCLAIEIAPTGICAYPTGVAPGNRIPIWPWRFAPTIGLSSIRQGAQHDPLHHPHPRRPCYPRIQGHSGRRGHSRRQRVPRSVRRYPRHHRRPFRRL